MACYQKKLFGSWNSNQNPFLWGCGHTLIHDWVSISTAFQEVLGPGTKMWPGWLFRHETKMSDCHHINIIRRMSEKGFWIHLNSSLRIQAVQSFFYVKKQTTGTNFLHSPVKSTGGEGLTLTELNLTTTHSILNQNRWKVLRWPKEWVIELNWKFVGFAH